MRTLSLPRATWVVACLVAAIRISTFAHAQGVTTGAIRGTVVDAQHAPVPFATITVKSPSMQGIRTVTTTDDGSYAVLQLPPGRYELLFEATRLQSASRLTTVRHGVGVEVNVTLQDAVSPDRGQPAVAAGVVASPTVASHFEHDEIDALATPRTLPVIAALAPGVTMPSPDANQVTVHGAFAYDTASRLNGVDIADNLSGAPQDLYVEDAIAETAVLTAGVPAEYGRFTGGVISAVTKSGGNRFSGSYRANLSNPSWTTATPLERCDPAVTLATCRPAAPRRDALLAWHEATLGGYLVKDRAWFFAAGRLAETSDSALLPLSGVLNTADASNQRGEVKLTARLGAGHTFTFDTAANRTTIDRQPSFASTVDPAAVGARSIPNYYDLASYRAALGTRAFLDAQFSLRRWERRDTASVSRALADSPLLARTIRVDGVPAHYNAPYFDAADPDKRNSLGAGGNLTYLLGGDAGGRHEIKGGYEFFRSERTGGNSQSPTGYIFDTDYLTEPDGATPALDANGRFIPLWVPGETLIENWIPTRGATLDVDTQTIYVTDHWAIGDRLSADAGVRYDAVKTRATDAFTNIESRTLQPRAGISYRIGDRRTQTLQASYGHYAGRYNEALVGRNTSLANPNLWVGVYVGGVGQGRSFAAGVDPANYLTLAGRFPTANVSVDEALQSPLVREFTASYAIEPGNGRGIVQAAYVWRDWRRFIDDFVSIANGTTHVVRSGFDVGTFTNVAYRNADAATRRYGAIELFGRYDVSRGWRVSGNYTVQLENDGNVPGELAGTPLAASALGDYPEIFSAARHYPDGRLATFERSVLRLWSTRAFDFGRSGALSVSGLLRVNSGRVYSLVAASQPLTAIQIARLQTAGYPDRPANQDLFFGARGSQSFNGYGVVDAAIAYDLPRFKGLAPWAKLEIYNALNNQTLIAWDTTIAPDPASPTDALGLPTGYRAAPRFGKATSNQHFPAPFPGATGGRTVRVALGVRF